MLIGRKNSLLIFISGVKAILKRKITCCMFSRIEEVKVEMYNKRSLNDTKLLIYSYAILFSTMTESKSINTFFSFKNSSHNTYLEYKPKVHLIKS